MLKRLGKYNARKTPCCHGHVHDSRKEAMRCDILHIHQEAGRIHGLETQKIFELIPAQKVGKWRERPMKYIADFYYITADGEEIVEDVKGLKKGAAYQLFTVKRKLMLYVHGIRVKEI